MSEYQYLHFQAIDAPLNDEQLEFMQRQSTRAEVSRWEFTNEYHYGDFRGDAAEMLRRGFDVHLYYANFGIRRLMFRLPAGLPWEKKTFDACCHGGEDDVRQAFQPDTQLGQPGKADVRWMPDKHGAGGILKIDPEADAGYYSEDVWDFGDLTSGLGRIREALQVGDLRPLYVAWLACCGDQDSLEPPVPAGIGELPKEFVAMAKFYEVDEDLLAAAAERSPRLPQQNEAKDSTQKWIAKRNKNELQELVSRLLTPDAAATRAETLAAIRREMGTQPWPVAEPSRTLGELLALAKSVDSQRQQREAAERQQQRENRLAEIVADPNKTLSEVNRLVKLRSTSAYNKAAQCLADLREALGTERGAKKAADAARRLVKENPTLHRLKSELRKQGLISK
jgi:hypothetical protein